MSQKIKPLTKRTEGETFIGKRGTTLLENKRERIYKDRRKNYVSYIIGIEANAQIRVEQDVDLFLKNQKLKIVGHPHDEVLNTTDPRNKHFKANKDRIILRYGLMFRIFLEKRVASNATKFSFQSNYLMK